MNLYTTYGSAYDYFEAVINAVRDEKKKLQTLERIEQREYSLPSGIIGTARGNNNESMSLTDAKIDIVERWKNDIQKDEELVDSAYKLLYGANENGGLCGLLSIQHAEILELHYIHDENWRRVAWKVGLSKRRVYDLRSMAFEFLDANGLTETAEGIGMA